jgi:UDP-3-O-[3-hydroxymyristoyl] glucosamine N-acyltransferase
MFGGQVGVAGHITIGDKVMLEAQSGANGSIDSNQTHIGAPPQQPRSFFKQAAISRRLPEIYKQVNQLQKEIQEIKQKIESNE